MIVQVFILVILIISYVFFIWSRRKFDYWKKKNVKYLQPIPFFGNYMKYMLQHLDLGRLTQGICNKFPEEPMIGAFYGTEPVLIVQDSELVKIVTTKDFYFFNGREISEHTHKEVLTRNLFFTYGDKWKVLRQNMTPLFSSAKMKNMFYLIQSCCVVFENLLDEETKLCNDLELRTLMARYTIDCICTCSFGIDAKAMQKGFDLNPFSKIATSIFDTSAVRGFKTVFRAVWPSVFYNLGLQWFPPEVDKFFGSILRNVFHERNGRPSTRNDFVDLVLTLKNNTFITGDSMKNLKGESNSKITLKVDDELLIAQCMLFFAAGFETSATTSSFLLFELAKHPEIQVRVLAEVDAYVATRSIVEYDCVTDLPYLDQCINETLRLYPVLPVLTRDVYEDYTMANGVTLERGLRIHIPVYHIHRNPKYFSSPNEFRPERFSAEEIKKIVLYTFMPFGEGPRLCIGKRFSKMQMIAGLVTLLKKYRVELAKGMPTEVEYQSTAMVTQMKQGIRLKLLVRDGWEQRVYRNGAKPD